MNYWQVSSGLLVRFGQVISNKWSIVFRSLKFQGFNFGISQAAVVFPFIVQAPRMFDKQITLGDMMQTVQAFGQVQEALSFFRSTYDDFILSADDNQETRRFCQQYGDSHRQKVVQWFKQSQAELS
jgi:ABC-type long-subunit fatty acid transport system fused permease/ATPase subunit